MEIEIEKKREVNEDVEKAKKEEERREREREEGWVLLSRSYVKLSLKNFMGSGKVELDQGR